MLLVLDCWDVPDVIHPPIEIESFLNMDYNLVYDYFIQLP